MAVSESRLVIKLLCQGGPFPTKVASQPAPAWAALSRERLCAGEGRGCARVRFMCVCLVFASLWVQCHGMHLASAVGLPLPACGCNAMACNWHLWWGYHCQPVGAMAVDACAALHCGCRHVHGTHLAMEGGAGTAAVWLQACAWHAPGSGGVWGAALFSLWLALLHCVAAGMCMACIWRLLPLPLCGCRHGMHLEMKKGGAAAALAMGLGARHASEWLLGDGCRHRLHLPLSGCTAGFWVHMSGGWLQPWNGCSSG